MKGEDRVTKELQKSVRCTKALLLLSSLRSPQNHEHNATSEESEEVEMLLRAIADLKIQLIKERLKNRNIRNCNLIEFFLQVLMLLSLLSLILLLAFEFE